MSGYCLYTNTPYHKRLIRLKVVYVVITIISFLDIRRKVNFIEHLFTTKYNLFDNSICKITHCK